MAVCLATHAGLSSGGTHRRRRGTTARRQTSAASPTGTGRPAPAADIGSVSGKVDFSH